MVAVGKGDIEGGEEEGGRVELDGDLRFSTTGSKPRGSSWDVEETI